MTSCGRCGLVTPCRVERCRRCLMVRVAACAGCLAETGGRVVEWQKASHERRCKNVPAVRECDRGDT